MNNVTINTITISVSLTHTELNTIQDALMRMSRTLNDEHMCGFAAQVNALRRKLWNAVGPDEE